MKIPFAVFCVVTPGSDMVGYSEDIDLKTLVYDTNMSL